MASFSIRRHGAMGERRTGEGAEFVVCVSLAGVQEAAGGEQFTEGGTEVFGAPADLREGPQRVEPDRAGADQGRQDRDRAVGEAGRPVVDLGRREADPVVAGVQEGFDDREDRGGGGAEGAQIAATGLPGHWRDSVSSGVWSARAASSMRRLARWAGAWRAAWARKGTAGADASYTEPC
ncbi:hypothetical protein [Streptomyces acidiscabies]|uniref:hypothetical protein n=1 Tax=Streptomyces acidiscabies TaxID=42234 RepID=UPI0015B78EA6|nr:hypothetical protein [Streptomyces acidiscabies]